MYRQTARQPARTPIAGRFLAASVMILGGVNACDRSFTCEDDTWCANPARPGGRCQVAGDGAGYCVYPTPMPDCGSHLAWDNSATRSLAGQCFVPPTAQPDMREACDWEVVAAAGLTGTTVKAVWVDEAGEASAVGDVGRLFQGTGTTWQSGASIGNKLLRAVRGVGSDLYILGGNGIDLLGEPSWAPGMELFGLWADPRIVVAVGTEGRFVARVPGSANPMPGNVSNAHPDLWTVIGTSDELLAPAGASVYRSAASYPPTWQLPVQKLPETCDVYGSWAAADGTVFFAGSRGKIFVRPVGLDEWQVVPAAASEWDFRAIWGLGNGIAAELFVVGQDVLGQSKGIILHRNDKGVWERLEYLCDQSLLPPLFGVYGTAGHVYAVGGTTGPPPVGIIIHHALR